MFIKHRRIKITGVERKREREREKIRMENTNKNKVYNWRNNNRCIFIIVFGSANNLKLKFKIVSYS